MEEMDDDLLNWLDDLIAVRQQEVNRAKINSYYVSNVKPYNSYKPKKRKRIKKYTPVSIF